MSTAAAQPPPLPTDNHAYGAQQGYGVQAADVEVEILPALPVGDRRQTLSKPKDDEPTSSTKVKAMHLMHKRVVWLDVPCGEVGLFLA